MAQVLPLWPLSSDAMASDRREICIGPQESEAVRSPEPSPPHSQIPLVGCRQSRRAPAQGHEPALFELSRRCGWTNGLTDERARTREEDRPHQGRRKRNRHGGSFKSHAGKRVAEEASRGGSQQTGLDQLLLRG